MQTYPSLSGVMHWKLLYIIKRVSPKLVDTTLYEMYYKKKSVLSHIKVWGCLAYVKRIILDKLDSKPDKCIFMRYPKELLEYYFYKPSE